VIRLTSIRLRNWKAYADAVIDLPVADTRNVAVFWGDNGAGKTSLLEAAALGLYGRDGVNLVSRARRSRAEASYDGFLERAVHAGARGREATMSVELVFDGTDLGRLSLQRVWYFSGAGRHLRDDEDIRIREGEDEFLAPIPGDAQREAFIRDYVAEHLLPPNLAPFFIFDGEHVDRLAGQDLEAQVRTAVDTVLGAPLLRQAIVDLRSYARERRRDSREANGDVLGDLRIQVSSLEAREDALEAEVEATNTELTPLRKARDDLVRRIGNLHGDSYASFKGLFEAREAEARSRSAQQEELRQALSVDLAFALCGEPLRQRAIRQLGAEGLRAQWEAGLKTSAAKYEAFLALVEARGPIPADQRSSLQAAWDAVWSQAPEGCSDERRHSHLGEADRHLVIRHLEQVSHKAGARIAELARDVQATDAAIQDLEDQISRQRGLDEQAQTLADDLRRVQEATSGLEAKHRTDVHKLDALRMELLPHKQELSRLIQRHAAAAPILRRADRAETYAAMLEDVIESTTPGHLAALSADITKAYRALAHKDLVETVRISPTGDVALLDAAGRDVRDLDTSAGENQIFALALMAAIADASAPFPIVMDTPLARLDPQHRRNVLQHFAGLGRQLVLLAHPAELTAEDLAAIQTDISGQVRIRNRTVAGEGVSRAEPLEVGDGA